MQQDRQLEQMRMQMQQQADQQRLQAEMQLEAYREQLIAEREERQAQQDAMIANQQMLQDQTFERFKALLESQTKIEVAHINAGASVESTAISAESKESEAE
jgi:bifunctional N-acetylglucosamine-1-phosphate-uridyltransferase/glucosamine-1-phosphate-acetyltransferase GlmU-like protein